MTMDRKDIDFILDQIKEVKKDNKEDVFEIKSQIERFYIDAHGMMDSFRIEFRENMKTITDDIKKIISKINSHDVEIVDIKKRIETLENNKRTLKQITYDIIKSYIIPIAIAITIVSIGVK
jgi:hypothetical protein